MHVKKLVLVSKFIQSTLKVLSDNLLGCLSDMNICTIVMHHFDLRSPEELEQMGLNATNPN